MGTSSCSETLEIRLEVKSVVITGATGFVGANLARACVKQGHEVYLFLRRGFKDWRLSGLEGHVHVYELDLCDPRDVEAALERARPDWLFHLAAYGAYEVQTDYLQALRTNVEATMVLLVAASSRGFELFAYAGSSSEYGFKDEAPAEGDPIEPNSIYAVTKASGTMFVRQYSQKRGLNAAILRLYSVYGPFEEPRRLMPAIVVAGLGKRYPPLVDPSIARDFIYVDDAVEAFLSLTRRPLAEPGRIFNVGSGLQTTLADVAAVASKIFGIAEPPIWGSMPARIWDTKTWISNPARIRKELGWVASLDVEGGLRAFADWLQRDAKMNHYYRNALAST